MTPPPTDTPPEVYAVWIDVETDGLDEQTGNLLEVGIVLTDRHHVEIARRSWVLHFHLPIMDLWVAAMHARSGLSAECLVSPLTREAAQEDILEWLRKHGVRSGSVSPPLLGGRNAHFDRRWLRAHLPRVVALLSHRGLDATTMRVEMAEVGITVAKGEAHRALADLDNDLTIARRHRQALRDGVDGRALAASLPRCKCGALAVWVKVGMVPPVACDLCADINGAWEPVPWDADAVLRLLTPLPGEAG